MTVCHKISLNVIVYLHVISVDENLNTTGDNHASLETDLGKNLYLKIPDLR